MKEVYILTIVMDTHRIKLHSECIARARTHAHQFKSNWENLN